VCHFFVFYHNFNTLLKIGRTTHVDQVRKWLKPEDAFTKEYILIPINVNKK